MSFDPSILMKPVAVNPQANWKIRANVKDAKVDFKGLANTLKLDENGLNYGLHPTRNEVLLWPAPKADAMVLKGSGMSGKMVSLIDFLRKSGVIKENHNVALLDIIDFDEDPTYKVIVLDEKQEQVYDEAQDATPEPADAEIADAVDA